MVYQIDKAPPQPGAMNEMLSMHSCFFLYKIGHFEGTDIRSTECHSSCDSGKKPGKETYHPNIVKGCISTLTVIS